MRSLLSVVVLLCLSPITAGAWELRWGAFEPSAHSDVAQTCTLSVWTAANDCPIRTGVSWRLVWAQKQAERNPAFLPEASESDPQTADHGSLGWSATSEVPLPLA